MSPFRRWWRWFFHGAEDLSVTLHEIDVLKHQNAGLATLLNEQRKDFEDELEKLRNVVSAHAEPAARQARNWREVKSLMGDANNG